MKDPKGTNTKIAACDAVKYMPLPASMDTPKAADGTMGPVTGLEIKTLEVHVLSDCSTCQKCGCAIADEEMLVWDNRKPTCLECAGLDHLVLLESGNATLTKRAVKQFGRKIVVLRIWKHAPAWRLGVLVDQESLELAEAQSAADAEKRAKSQAKAAARRKEKDTEFAGKFAEKIGLLYPGCPVDEREAIARRACERGSGRVGRSASGQQLDENAIKRAVRAHIRHAHTDYDQLMDGQVGRDWAHDRVRSKVDDVFNRWQAGTSASVEGDPS